MKKKLSILLLSCLAGPFALAQQPTAPASRTLTPAEQRQKEKIAREVERERQIRAEWLQKQREYEAKQADKERLKAAKKAEKEREQQARETPKTQPVTETPAATPTSAPTNQPTESPSVTPVAEPARKERKKKQETTTTTPRTLSTASTPADTPPPASSLPAPNRPERVRRQKATSATPAPDSAATASGVSSAAATSPTSSRPSGEFLPKGHLFEPILLDPLEAQTYGSVLPTYWTEGKKYAGSIVPFAFGFAKPFYRHTSAADRSEEWVLDLASFTQFEAFYDYKADRARRQIMNNDYKISIIYNIRRGENNYRIRVYHLSSHLGDDYIYRNQITAPSPNSVNYEQLDFTYSRTVNNWRLYGGAGITLRKSEERKLLSAQLGTFYKKPSTKAARLVGGVDVKFFQQTDFRPGIHGGIGIELGHTQNNLTFLFEGYSGFRPYSQFENQQTSWMGIGLYLNPF
jgi:hypothetical protein